MELEGNRSPVSPTELLVERVRREHGVLEAVAWLGDPSLSEFQ